MRPLYRSVRLSDRTYLSISELSFQMNKQLQLFDFIYGCDLEFTATSKVH